MEVLSAEIKKIEEELEELEEGKRQLEREREWEMDKEAFCWWGKGSQGLHKELEEGEKAWKEYMERLRWKVEEETEHRKYGVQNDKEEGNDEEDDCVLVTADDCR